MLLAHWGPNRDDPVLIVPPGSALYVGVVATPDGQPAAGAWIVGRVAGVESRDVDGVATLTVWIDPAQGPATASGLDMLAPSCAFSPAGERSPFFAGVDDPRSPAYPAAAVASLRAGSAGDPRYVFGGRWPDRIGPAPQGPPPGPNPPAPPPPGPGGDGSDGVP